MSGVWARDCSGEIMTMCGSQKEECERDEILSVDCVCGQTAGARAPPAGCWGSRSTECVKPLVIQDRNSTSATCTHTGDVRLKCKYTRWKHGWVVESVTGASSLCKCHLKRHVGTTRRGKLTTSNCKETQNNYKKGKLQQQIQNDQNDTKYNRKMTQIDYKETQNNQKETQYNQK